ncbi:MAG: TIGR04282 family arsenosugar biosynthesis glycosyltransferase [Gaiella sp.]
MTETVLVVAKAPSAGRSKTRLVPPLTPEQAAGLHEALLVDTIAACRSASADVRILYASAGDAPALTKIAPDVPLVLQEGRGLAAALERGIARHVVDGPCAIVSSDIPGVPQASLGRAFAELERGADVVIGPAHDGGYWLIAMREHHAAPFRDIPWSTPAAAAVTRARCADAGLTVVELERWRDIDTLVDLAALAASTEALQAPRTRAFLSSLDGNVPSSVDVELLSSELLAGSPWRAILRDRLRVDGREREYAYLGVPRAVFVAAVTGDGELLLVRQYRHPVRDWTLEVPAGSVVDGETPLEAARRELREEAGATGGAWHRLTTFFSSSAHLSLRSDAFLATGVTLGAAEPEDDEDVTLVRMPVGDAVSLARVGGFAEGQTALTILLAAERLEQYDHERGER